MCHFIGQKVVKCPVGCLSERQNVVTCPTTFCMLVPHCIQQVPLLPFSPLPLKRPESTRVIRPVISCPTDTREWDTGDADTVLLQVLFSDLSVSSCPLGHVSYPLCSVLPFSTCPCSLPLSLSLLKQFPVCHETASALEIQQTHAQPCYDKDGVRGTLSSH